MNDISYLVDEIERLTRERDAAIADLEAICHDGTHGMCEYCGADCIDAKEEVDDTWQCGCFVWRGVQEEGEA